MSFNANIPNVTDFLAISQKQMLANYLTIFNAFNQNHVSLSTPTTAGMHNSLTLRPLNTDPVTIGGQCALYNKLVNSTPQLFFRSDTNKMVIQLTNSNYAVHANPFYISTFVAGPFTVYLGYVKMTAANTVVVNLVPATTLIYVSTVTIAAFPPLALFPQVVAASNITGSQFTLTKVGGADFIPPAVYFLAIGN